jgi:hypothetical protein
VSGKLVMPALRNFELVLEHPLDRAAMKACVEAVDALVKAAEAVAKAATVDGRIRVESEAWQRIAEMRNILANFKEA